MHMKTAMRYPLIQSAWLPFSSSLYTHRQEHSTVNRCLPDSAPLFFLLFIQSKSSAHEMANGKTSKQTKTPTSHKFLVDDRGGLLTPQFSWQHKDWRTMWDHVGIKEGYFFILMSVKPKFLMAATAFVRLTTLVAMEEWSSSSVMGKNEIKKNNGLFFS